MKAFIIHIILICIGSISFGQIPLKPIDILISDNFYTDVFSNWRLFNRDYKNCYRGDSLMIAYIKSDSIYRDLESAIHNCEHATRLELINQRNYNHFHDLDKLTQLQYLNLNHAQNQDYAIQELPIGIYQLEKLQVLEANNNDIKYLSYQIGNLRKLEYLSLRKNDISALPPEIGSLSNLIFLDLSDNNIKYLPDNLSELTNLRYLNLSGNPILLSIGSLLSEMHNLEFLSINIESKYAMMFTLQKIKHLPNLKVLHLRYSNLYELPEVLKAFDQVEQLSLRGNFDLDLEQAFDIIADMKSLKILDLSFSQITSLPENFSNLTQIKTIYLGNHSYCCPLINWSGKPPYNHIEKLPKSASQLKNLENLYLWSWGYTEKQKMKIKKLLPHVNIEFDSDRNDFEDIPNHTED